MLKKSSRVFFRLFSAGFLFLAVSSAYLIHKEHETLTRLLNPGSDIKTTDVYSRWLNLNMEDAPSWDHVAGWLGTLGYRLVPGAPTVPGDYHAVYPTLIVFARPFRYPDKDFPAQL